MELGRQSIVEWAESASSGGADFTPAQEKYRVENSIGSGGMGEVLLVTDQDLRRQVAMKVIRQDAAIGRDQRLHFIAEAQATSQLEHPGIPPVHDIGITKDGRLYFTMKLVRGRTLADVVRDLALKRRDVQREYSLHRLVTILERIAETLNFSHERGVIHRDVKPENVMLGDYGEVHLVDWGLARVRSDSAECEEVKTARTDAGLQTQFGTLKGTVPYMSPEQARGEAESLDSRTDIYALGCVLYEVLTLHPAFDPHEPDLLAKVQVGDCPDVETRDPGRHVPAALAASCRKAMAPNREDRYRTARELAVALRAWLDGTTENERRRAEAQALVKKGQDEAQHYEILKGLLRESEAEAGVEAAKCEPWQPIVEKLPALAARRHSEALRIRIARAFAETTQSFNGALGVDPQSEAALRALAELWRDRVIDAESRGDKEEAAHALAMTGRYDRGLWDLVGSEKPQIYRTAHPQLSEHDKSTVAYREQLAAFLVGNGILTLVSDPPDAIVRIYRFEETPEGLFAAVDPGRLAAPRNAHTFGTALSRTNETERAPFEGRTPLEPVDLGMGSYVCVLTREGFRETRLPVHITRGRKWNCTVKLRTVGELGGEVVHVPAGPFVYGEERMAKTIELPDFAIARHPVTFGEYALFLAALDEYGVKRHMPWTSAYGPLMEKTSRGDFHPLPSLVRGITHERCVERHGPDYLCQIPVVGVSWDNAVAYCRWKSETEGHEWRLPTEEEREKAARGVDGRCFPWGDIEDPSLGKCCESRPEAASLEPVGAFPTAESVYGMRDAAGGVWEWTSSWWDERHSSRVLRGGSWTDRPTLLRCASRLARPPGERSSDAGFRCARGL